MKKLLPQCFVLFLFCLSVQVRLFAQVGGVGISATGLVPDSTAMLDVSSAGKGLLIPRMSTAQINAIQSPATYLMVIDTTTKCVEIYGFGSWQTISCMCTGAPSAPGTISGNGNPCANATNVTYSIAPVSGADSYAWTVPSDATIASGQGTNAITVNFGVNPGNISVSATNKCGTSNTSALPITINTIPSTPGTINGSSSFYRNQSGVGYSIAAISGATMYSWTVPGDATIANGQGTDSITLNFGVDNGSICVTPGNTCGTNGDNCITVTACTTNGPQTFNYTGASQTFTVPCGIDSINIQVWGASGGSTGPNNGGDGEAVGGPGGFATGSLAVTPGQLLEINVGGMASSNSSAGGWNGGGTGGSYTNQYAGGGGGASDVRLMSDTSLNGRIIVAGGGGGGANGAGGYGGGTVGYSMGSTEAQGSNDGTSGGGTQNAGGAAGVGLIASWPSCAANGNAGGFGTGANGVYTDGVGECDIYTSGGGGGGWYGGGSGGTSGDYSGRPGGGGSGYIGGVNNGSMQTGIQSGNGQVVISW